jgi:hypothetical protein
MDTNTGDDATRSTTQADADTSARVLLGLIMLVALGVRVYGIGSLLPIMVDEAIYLRWAEIVHHQHQWFIALLDGKQPLCSWLYAPLLMENVKDPFLAARGISVVAGVAATLVIFLVADGLGGAVAGLFASALYAVAPYSVFYAHLAYNEGILDLLTAASVLSAMMAFWLRPASPWTAASTGLWLGVGFLCKSSFLPFFAFPLAICLLRARDRWRLLIVTYAVAAVIPAALYLSVPAAPMSSSSHFVVHQLNYFIDRKTLTREPLIEAAFNLPLMFEYLNVYLTLPMILGSVVAWAYLAKERLGVPALMLPFTLAVLSAELVFLRFLPSRYLFPYLWPLFVAAGCAVARTAARRNRLVTAFALLVLCGMSVRSIAILVAPQRHLHAVDVDHFVKANCYSGYGVRDAAEFIRATARKDGPLILLTDPVWGLPADAMFVFLNGRDGVTVHEAWWIELSNRYPLLPAGPVSLMKSHYERVYGGSVDFDRVRSVLYVTDTAYVSVEDVRRRQQNATRIATFRKPGSVESIDVYRLR